MTECTRLRIALHFAKSLSLTIKVCGLTVEDQRQSASFVFYSPITNSTPSWGAAGNTLASARKKQRMKWYYRQTWFDLLRTFRGSSNFTSISSADVAVIMDCGAFVWSEFGLAVPLLDDSPSPRSGIWPVGLLACEISRCLSQVFRLHTHTSMYVQPPASLQPSMEHCHQLFSTALSSPTSVSTTVQERAT